MANDIGGFGFVLTLKASVTFPFGFTVTQWADDADPADMPSQQLKDKAMGLNGDLITWSKANPLVYTLSVIPSSEDDKNLEILADANRAARGKLPVNDVITITAIYPDGSTITLINGAITDAMITDSIASAGRKKSKVYAFAFEDVTRS